MGKEPEDKFESKKLRNIVARHTLIDGELYRCSFTFPYLKCLIENKVEYALCEVYEGVCKNNLKARTITHKLLR